MWCFDSGCSVLITYMKIDLGHSQACLLFDTCFVLKLFNSFMKTSLNVLDERF